MKPIHVLGIILAGAFAIVWCFQMWSAGQWKTTTLQGEGSGNFYEQRRRRADAEAFVREAFNDTPRHLQREAFSNTLAPIQSEDFMREAAIKSLVHINHATDVSGPSWWDRLQNTITGWMRSIKGGVQQMLPQSPPSQTRLAPPPAMADDFKNIDGKKYKEATVTGVEIDGITVKTKSGISKVYFVELPKEVQQRFHYDPQAATAYAVQQCCSVRSVSKAPGGGPPATRGSGRAETGSRRCTTSGECCRSAGGGSMANRAP